MSPGRSGYGGWRNGITGHRLLEKMRSAMRLIILSRRSRGTTRGFQLPAKCDYDLVTRSGDRISAVLGHTCPGGATWKKSSRKSCRLSRATFDGGTRRRNTWKNLQVLCLRRKGRSGTCWRPFTTSEPEPIRSW